MSRGQKSKRRKLGSRKRRRNRRYWRRVIARQYEKIFEIARCFTKNISDAQDLAQTVILRLLKYSPKPVRIINLDAYIYVSTKHAWLDLQRPRREISFSDLKKADLPKVAALDPNLSKFLETCDIKALMGRKEVNDAKLLQTKILIEAGFSLPDIALMLDEPVRRTRYRWYKYRDTQQKALRSLSAKNLSSSRIH